MTLKNFQRWNSSDAVNLPAVNLPLQLVQSGSLLGRRMKLIFLKYNIFIFKTSFTEIIRTQCQKERDIAKSPLITDIFVPVCDKEGNYVPHQCFEHNTFGKQCWCVDSSGQEIKETRVNDGTTPKCGTFRRTVAFI